MVLKQDPFLVTWCLGGENGFEEQVFILDSLSRGMNHAE